MLKKEFRQQQKHYYHHDSQKLWPKTIIEDMEWFPFQGTMLYAANHINSPAENFRSLLKLFSMFKIRIQYDETIIKIYILQILLE